MDNDKKLIGEFLYGTLERHLIEVIDSYQYYFNTPLELEYILDIDDFYPKQDWEVLMKCLDKIETLDHNGIYTSIKRGLLGEHSMYIEGKINYKSYSHSNKADTKIQVVYEGIIAFIKWYNSIKRYGTK